MCIRDSPYTKALRELTDVLVDVLQHESNVVATKAWSRGLIGDELYHNTTLSPRERAAQIIMAVSSRVRTDKGAFDKILKCDSSLKYLADKLLEKVRTLDMSQQGSTGHQLGPPALKDLLKELNKVASKWENLGIMLGIDSGKLDTVKADHARSCDCVKLMFKIWLKTVDPTPTWSALAEALEVLGEPKLAKELTQKYCA